MSAKVTEEDIEQLRCARDSFLYSYNRDADKLLSMCLSLWDELQELKASKPVGNVDEIRHHITIIRDSALKCHGNIYARACRLNMLIPPNSVLISKDETEEEKDNKAMKEWEG